MSLSAQISPAREFIFIRHGESVSNADLPTEHPQTIALTPKGAQQALDKAATWQIAPDIFITSKYIRTQLTAAPFRAKFPDVPHEEWDIHEFTYLDPVKYRGTTVTQRRPHTDAYWQKADPYHKDSPEAESFAEFAARCQTALARIRQSQHQRSIAFCHGYFMKGLVLALDGHFDEVSDKTMALFNEFHHRQPLDNCAVLRLHINDDQIAYTFDASDTRHAAISAARTD